MVDFLKAFLEFLCIIYRKFVDWSWSKPRVWTLMTRLGGTILVEIKISQGYLTNNHDLETFEVTTASYWLNSARCHDVMESFKSFQFINHKKLNNTFTQYTLEYNDESTNSEAEAKMKTFEEDANKKIKKLEDDLKAISNKFKKESGGALVITKNYLTEVLKKYKTE